MHDTFRLKFLINFMTERANGQHAETTAQHRQNKYTLCDLVDGKLIFLVLHHGCTICYLYFIRIHYINQFLKLIPHVVFVCFPYNWTINNMKPRPYQFLSCKFTEIQRSYHHNKYISIIPQFVENVGIQSSGDSFIWGIFTI